MARRKSRARVSRMTNGRQGLWVRHETFTPSDVVTAPKYTEDAVIFPSLWEREVQDLTNPKRGRGGALMKRFMGSVNWEILQADDVSTVLTPVFEVLVFAASTEEPAASAAADFGANLESQRVLHYSMIGPDTFGVVANASATASRWWATLRYDIKVAAKLPGQDIVLSTRCSESETASVGIRVRAQVSSYLTTP